MLYRTWVARDLAEIGALTGRDDLVRRGLRRSGRATAGLFAFAGSREGTARFPMDGDDIFELPAIGPGFSSGPANWIEGFYAALAVRDDETLDRLCQTPAEAVTNGPGTTTSRYSDTWRRCLRAVWRRSPEVGTLLAGALQQTGPLLTDCWLDGPIILSHATAATVRMSGCHVPGRAAENVHTSADLMLDHGFTARGPTQTRLNNEHDPAFHRNFQADSYPAALVHTSEYRHSR